MMGGPRGMSGPGAISRLAWRRYCGAPVFVRVLMTLRPYICPLEVVAEAVPAGSRVLDIGCGAGLFLRWLAHARGISGVGVDVEPRAVRAAQAAAEPGETLEFVCCRPGEPWPAGDFGAVTLVDVLHHVPPGEQRAFIGRIGQTSARTAIVKDVDTRPRRKVWANALHDFLMTRRRVYPRTMAEVALWLREDGFTVTRSERVGRLCYAHYLIVAER